MSTSSERHALYRKSAPVKPPAVQSRLCPLTTSPVLPTIEQSAPATAQQRRRPILDDQSSTSHSPPSRVQIDLCSRPRHARAGLLPYRARAFVREVGSVSYCP